MGMLKSNQLNIDFNWVKEEVTNISCMGKQPQLKRN